MEIGFVMTLPAAMSTIPAELRLIQSLAFSQTHFLSSHAPSGERRLSFG
jgi:hypothetical protein